MSDLSSSAIATARYHVDNGLVRESEGKNRSPVIDAMCRTFGAPLGSPYCALGVSWCFRNYRLLVASDARPFPYTASSQYIKRIFGQQGLLSRDPDALMGWKGALGGWTNPDGAHGHVFFIEKRWQDENGHVIAIGTIEYNTNGQGERDGEGAFRLMRRKSVKDGLWYVVDADGKRAGTGRALWFVDTSDIGGGAWWD